MNKIFQIGFNKCGTMSLYELFHSYTSLKAVHWDLGKLALSIRNNFFDRKPLLNDYQDYDVFTDMECCYIENNRTFGIFIYQWFHILDQKYPNSKFILNTRDINNWVGSRLNHSCGMMLINGSVARLEPKESYVDRQLKLYQIESIPKLITIWKKEWEEHHTNVINYFSHRPQDLLVFDIEKDIFSKIVNFFKPCGIIFNTESMPHANKTKDET